MAVQGIALTDRERESLEVTDFGLGRLEEIGLQLLTYVNTDRCCAKELVLFPYQTCPEHRHPSQGSQPGKEETFRCRCGEVYLYISGDAADTIRARRANSVFTVFHEVVLRPGEQYTLMPDTLHWFQAGADGCIVSEFSTHSDDATDIFSDLAIRRLPAVDA